MTSVRFPQTIHASAVWAEGVGVLARGGAGSGKSSLVLALILANRERNQLIADDRVALTSERGQLFAAAPASIEGLLEIRGQGLVRLPHRSPAPIGLIVDLEPLESCQRMPDPENRSTMVEGVSVARLSLPVGAHDGWIRVLAAIAFGSNFHDG